MTPSVKMRGSQMYVIFGVGIGNLGRTKWPRIPMADLMRKMNGDLVARGSAARIVGSFAHTGNFVALCERLHDGEGVAELRSCFDFEAAVLPVGEVRAALERFAGRIEPEDEVGVRWTAGMGLHVSGTVHGVQLKRTGRAVLWRIAPTLVGIWKRDVEGADGTLDRANRAGGWGALASEIGEQLGGRWTARSLRTVRGVMSSAEALG